MYSFTNNGSFAKSFGWDDRDYYTQMPQQNAPVIGGLSRSDLHGPSGSHRKSYATMVAGFPLDMTPWPNNGPPCPSAYREGGWPSNQYLDETSPGSLFNTPGGSVIGSEVDLFTGMQVAPLVEQGIPSNFQLGLPPPPIRTYASGPWQSTSSWYHPVHADRQHSDCNTSIGSPGTGPDIQLAGPSRITDHSEKISCQTDRFHPTVASSSMQFLAHYDHVPVSPPPPGSRGERWDLPNASTFQCWWKSWRGTRCSAVIAGDRRSVTSHLRDEHDFTCDGQTIACAWSGCTAWMQRRNIPRHIIACHFGIKVTCDGCGLALSRTDANKKHRLACVGVKEAAEEDAQGGYF